jgi:hypothetical protein
MWNYANDFDFYRQWANVVVNGRFEAVIERPYAVMYVGRRDGRPYALAHDEVRQQFASLLVGDMRMEGVFAAAMGNQGYMLRDPDLERLFEAAREIHRLAA